jgi:hypothetical protein
MRLELSDYKGVYTILAKSHELCDSFDEPDEDWKKAGEDEELAGLKRDNGLMTETIMLPPPLWRAAFAANRFNDWYSAFYLLRPKEEEGEAFKGISDELAKRVAEKELKFAATSPDGTGLIYEDPTRPLMGIMDAQNGGRDIGIGDNGAMPRKFGEFDDFQIDLRNDLGWLVNVYIDVVLNSYRAEEKGYDKFPDITFWFPPNYDFR